MTFDQSNTTNATGKNWWTVEEAKRHEHVFAFIKLIDQRQSYRQADNLRYLRLFSNFEVLGLTASDYSARNTIDNGINNRVTLNVIQNMCEAVHSKITKNKPKPTFLTSNGDWGLQQRAKKLTKFCEGQFWATKTYAKGAISLLDSTIFGTGCVKVFKSDSKVKVERVFINEIIVDDEESIYEEPRQMHQCKYIHRDVLVNMFPKKKKEIGEIKNSSNDFQPASKTSDMIKVVESWHIPSGPDAKDGRHSITIANATLFDEQYDKFKFPFAFIRWTVRPLGFFGQGLAEQLQGIQLEINKILRTIQVSMHLTSIPKVFIDTASHIISNHLNNEIGGIIKYTGTKPSYESVGAVPQELFDHLDRLYQRAFEITGISQLSASSAKPAGLDSGKALREFSDIETERFAAVGIRYQDFFMEICELMIDVMRDIQEDDNDITVKTKSGKFLETIKWKDVNIEDTKYLMQVFPTSALASTPSARLKDVEDLLAAGLIEKEDALSLLDFPDLEKVNNLQTAAVENINFTIDKMMETGKFIPPEPFQNLFLGIKKFQESYLHHKNQNAPDARLELLRQWMDDANALIEKAQEAENNKLIREQEKLATAQALGQISPEEAQLPPIPTDGDVPVDGQLPPEVPINPENPVAEEVPAPEEGIIAEQQT